ncbi:hypothetical protein EDM57_04905 [Brevibacillus gelatini]|uniref:Uncharacterized protein n=1 Tax=Brevibacillus gelatini TaxID=1655277 RepID=A0A3M8B7Q5_9BACL|nr:hypothetical protein [Brevibacillus gelatini]RNB59484.1 hypothetical protein EDM57_04905 [Brevibacillus gelatini]
MYKLTNAQQLLLFQLSKPYHDGEKHHPKDAYNTRTVESLVKLKLIEEYHYNRFLHGAIRLTDEGKRTLMDL